nr:RHS repeat-associated core domain-containing protein [Luteolibacter marinus]
MQGAGGVGGLLAVEIESGADAGVYYPTYDGNGNISEYLDASAVVVAHFEYDPFGEEVVATGSKVALFDYRFSTKPLDAETGYFYYGYRYYDPVQGRWPSRDPIGERGGLNLYGFVYNNPNSWYDILGGKPGGSGWKSGPSKPNTGAGSGEVNKQNRKLAPSLPDVFPHDKNNPFQHCVWNCRMTKDHGREFAEQMSWEKEKKDVAMAKRRDKLLAQGRWDDLSDWEQDWIQAHADSAMQPSDFDDNRTGRNCGESVDDKDDCECCCKNAGLSPGPANEGGTPEGTEPGSTRPYGPYSEPGSTNGGVPDYPDVTPPHLR